MTDEPDILPPVQDKHRNFVHEYVKDFNMSRAAIRAGYSSLSPWTIARNILDRPEVQEYLNEIRGRIEDECRVSAARVLAEVGAIAFSNMGDYLSFDPDTGVTLRTSEQLSELQLSAIKSVKCKHSKWTDKDGNDHHSTNFEFALHDKGQAMDKLMRHLGMYDDTLKLDASDKLTELLNQVNGTTHGKLPSQRGG